MDAHQPVQAIISLSLNNPYFSRDHINELIDYTAAQHYHHIYIMIPDLPTESTLIARGYTPLVAQRKARLEANRLENHVHKALEHHHLPALNISIDRWKDVAIQPQYMNQLSHLATLFHSHHIFKKDVEHLTKQIINKHGTTLDHTTAVSIGVQFVLQELAYIINTAETFSGTTHYLYHRSFPILEKFNQGAYGIEPKNPIITFDPLSQNP